MKNKIMYIFAGGGGSFLSRLSAAFTMAEILLSLTIIGVVAAITLPSLTGNINERTWNTQRKALFARMSQAISLMPAINNYGTLSGTIGDDEDRTQTITADTAAETFVTSGLSKVLKINNICDNEHLSDCGLPEQIVKPDGTKFAMPTKASDLSNILVKGIDPPYNHLDTKTAGFETVNGESIDVIYIPDCKPDMNENSYYLTQTKLCAVMIFDLNGKKGPNTFGKDIGFISVTYPTDSVVSMPIPHQKVFDPSDYTTAVQNCRSLGDEYRLPTKEEASSIVAARKLFTGGNGLAWTSTPITKNGGIQHWVQGFGGDISPKSAAGPFYTWCVKRF
ncbi:MAG: hypothetical protein NC390_00205 [Fusobacterium sp.]|nr:hypothetical protein [Fusobacterium sp.]